ncbi:pyruvate/2-oxoglutarate dehydrogenase complex, dehydrogenase (E1) component, eukaryotic type, alpha subunit [Lactococcus lactis subsp. lactis]|uniref:Pyruvate/2-oxoglutarate dehydrogenase complex, dehydrogenase (E1) component, eukaryotic type, alpha subunit n=1 Tax=Lactococcus lactis subsp. lactis TaxID=1360 RepID=A0A0B8QLZ3_LACLL|nr:pyruvate/2-oxoglutarate dehydrogenase complex, dehydrogenase (E1) component, eukaryotic type, alpha subunit [Lactococcus lactis subsp. lactis]
MKQFFLVDHSLSLWIAERAGESFGPNIVWL